jgi:hypothetical protein
MGLRIAGVLLVAATFAACGKPHGGASEDKARDMQRELEAAEQGALERLGARTTSFNETIGAIEVRVEKLKALGREYDALTPEQKEAAAPEYRRRFESMKAQFDHDIAAFRAGRKGRQ